MKGSIIRKPFDYGDGEKRMNGKMVAIIGGIAATAAAVGGVVAIVKTHPDWIANAKHELLTIKERITKRPVE